MRSSYEGDRLNIQCSDEILKGDPEGNGVKGDDVPICHQISKTPWAAGPILATVEAHGASLTSYEQLLDASSWI